ncbi:hypothetical protein [Scytonema sp. NUACC26]
MQDQWYKNAIAYSLDVETFMDSDSDGTVTVGSESIRCVKWL